MTDPYDMSDDELEAAVKAIRELDQQEPTNDVDNAVEDETVDDDVDSTSEEQDVEDQDDTTDDSEEQEEDDADSETDTTEVGDDETEAKTEDNSAGKTKAEKSKDVAVVSESHKFKANGKEYEFTDKEIKEQFPKIFGQAMDYTKKMQAIKPWRKTIDALEEAKLQHEDINLMIDVLKGDKDAIAEVLKRTGVDAIDINTEESNYKRNDYGRDGKALDLKEVISDISGDPEYTITHRILSKDWDDASWNELTADPEKIRLLHVDVQSGLYALLQPEMDKAKLSDRGRKSDIEYYFEASRKYFEKEADKKQLVREEALNKREKELQAQTRVAKVQTDEQKRTASKQVVAKRKAAATTGRAVTKSGPIDYLNASEEDFEEWYKRIETN